MGKNIYRAKFSYERIKLRCSKKLKKFFLLFGSTKQPVKPKTNPLADIDTKLLRLSYYEQKKLYDSPMLGWSKTHKLIFNRFLVKN